jgi:hypothetical protein
MFRTLRAAALLGAIMLAGLFALSRNGADAHVVNGQFSMEAAVGETNVANGGQFAAYVGIYHSGGSYQAAQWYIDYPESIVQVVNMARDPAAPGQCSASGDDGSRVLLGCVSLDLSSPLSYSGNAWIVAFKCIVNGTANIDVVTNTNVPSHTQVLNNNSNELPLHGHGDAVVCGSGGGPVPTPTPAPPPSGDLCTVQSVLSGDSFMCTDGKTIRMLQIDAQDLSECGGGWAKAAMQYIFLTPGRVVALDYDSKKTDSQGRTLAAPNWRGNDGAD